MFGTCGCNSGCSGVNNRGLFGICLNDATLIIILIAIWLLTSNGCGYSGSARSGCGCGCGCD